MLDDSRNAAVLDFLKGAFADSRISVEPRGGAYVYRVFEPWFGHRFHLLPGRGKRYYLYVDSQFLEDHDARHITASLHKWDVANELRAVRARRGGGSVRLTATGTQRQWK